MCFQSLIKQINTVADLITSFLLLFLLPVLIPSSILSLSTLPLHSPSFPSPHSLFLFPSILSLLPSLFSFSPSLNLQAQYVYIHDALQEYIVCGDASIPAEKIRNAMVSLQKVSDHKEWLSETV